MSYSHRVVLKVALISDVRSMVSVVASQFRSTQRHVAIVLFSRVGAIQDNDSFFGVNPKTSTRFDRNFSISDFLKINAGTELALPLVSRCGRISLVCSAVVSLRELWRVPRSCYLRRSLACYCSLLARVVARASIICPTAPLALWLMATVLFSPWGIMTDPVAGAGCDRTRPEI